MVDGRGTFAWRVAITKAYLLDLDREYDVHLMSDGIQPRYKNILPSHAPQADTTHSPEGEKQPAVTVLSCCDMSQSISPRTQRNPRGHRTNKVVFSGIQITNAEKISFVCPASFRMDRRSIHEVHPIPGDCGLRCRIIREPDIFNRLEAMARMFALRTDAIGTKEYPSSITIGDIHHCHEPCCGVDLGCIGHRILQVCSVSSVLLGEIESAELFFGCFKAGITSPENASK